MSELSVVDRSTPLSPGTPVLQRIVRGIVWAWSIALGFAAVMLFRAVLAGGLTSGAAIAQELASFASITFALMTAAGIVAAFVAPLLAGYPRACFLGLLVVLPLLVILIGLTRQGTWQVGGMDLYNWLVAGLGLGALLRWRRGNQGWPVGDDWP
jgi:hypothetical protein